MQVHSQLTLVCRAGQSQLILVENGADCRSERFRLQVVTYSLEFDQRALKEWHKLGDTIRQQFKKKLAEILENPRIEANRLRELPDCYKVKLRSAGYRLIYQVIDQEIVVFVVAIDKRENEAVYRKASERLS